MPRRNSLTIDHARVEKAIDLYAELCDRHPRSRYRDPVVNFDQALLNSASVSVGLTPRERRAAELIARLLYRPQNELDEMVPVEPKPSELSCGTGGGWRVDRSSRTKS